MHDLCVIFLAHEGLQHKDIWDTWANESEMDIKFVISTPEKEHPTHIQNVDGWCGINIVSNMLSAYSYAFTKYPSNYYLMTTGYDIPICHPASISMTIINNLQSCYSHEFISGLFDILTPNEYGNIVANESKIHEEAKNISFLSNTICPDHWIINYFLYKKGLLSKDNFNKYRYKTTLPSISGSLLFESEMIELHTTFPRNGYRQFKKRMNIHDAIDLCIMLNQIDSSYQKPIPYTFRKISKSCPLDIDRLRPHWTKRDRFIDVDRETRKKLKQGFEKYNHSYQRNGKNEGGSEDDRKVAKEEPVNYFTAYHLSSKVEIKSGLKLRF